jgi:hypothetical protein
MRSETDPLDFQLTLLRLAAALNIASAADNRAQSAVALLNSLRTAAPAPVR